MFSADYSHENSEEAATFIEQLPVSRQDRKNIAFRVAEMLF
jgi:predicted TIM-barrel fold metal-dependent hydrolase